MVAGTTCGALSRAARVRAGAKGAEGARSPGTKSPLVPGRTCPMWEEAWLSTDHDMKDLHYENGFHK